MQNERLKEILRPIASAVSPAKALSAQRHVMEAFRDDGGLERSIVSQAMPLQRLDWIVAPGAPAGVQDARYFVPESARATRISLVSTANASATFGVDVLVNGAARSGGSIRAGTDRSSGVFSIDLPGGSVVSVQTKGSIDQGVTVSVFYRPVEE